MPEPEEGHQHCASQVHCKGSESGLQRMSRHTSEVNKMTLKVENYRETFPLISGRVSCCTRTDRKLRFPND